MHFFFNIEKNIQKIFRECKLPILFLFQQTLGKEKYFKFKLLIREFLWIHP